MTAAVAASRRRPWPQQRRAVAHEDWRATAKYLTYRGLGAAMGHMPLPLAQGVARGVARFMALRGGPALAMNERHMRRVLASECVEGVEPDPALVRRWSRRTFDSYARVLGRRRPPALRERGGCARPLAPRGG